MILEPRPQLRECQPADQAGDDEKQEKAERGQDATSRADVELLFRVPDEECRHSLISFRGDGEIVDVGLVRRSVPTHRAS